MTDYSTATSPVDLKGATVPPIVIKGRTAPLVIENGVTDSIGLVGCVGIVFKGMKVGDQGTSPIPSLTNKAVQIVNSPGCQLLDSEITRADCCVLVRGSDDAVIDGNVFHDFRRDVLHYGDSHRLRVTRNEAFDWFPALGDHTDGFQGWSNAVAAKDVVFAQNCLHRGKSAYPDGKPCWPQGMNDRIAAAYKPFINLLFDDNLLIGMASNGIEAYYDVIVQNNVLWSFLDQPSMIRAALTARLINNEAIKFAVNKVASVPAGNRLNKAIDPSQEAALVAAWRAKVLPVVAPPVDVPPAPQPVTFSPEQKVAVRAALEAIGAL